MYSKTVIYKLVCNDPNIKEIYVGSTCNFTRRKSKHKSRCNDVNDKAYNQKNYQFIREHGGWENWSMVIIEKYPCNDNIEKRIRERYWYELLNGQLNMTRPHITDEELKEYKKEHTKEYNKDNTHKISANKKQYYENNKNDILEKAKTKYTCQCGSICSTSSKSHHMKSKKHLNYINSTK
jgi:hypothetical protein